ncbi:MAG TPA: cyclic nucleotide-binding domain-containing protein [Gallionella sp.]|nr:cyclic nucleotide-binding domain-containing protein [Gallionella sp.]
MSLVTDTLRASTITEGLSDVEIGILAGVCEIIEYKDGEVILKPGGPYTPSLYILAQGDVDVKVLAGEEESTVHVLKPGDLAAVITFVGGDPSEISATLYAMGDVKMLSLDQTRFKSLIETHPLLVYHVMQGVVRNVDRIVRSVNELTAEMNEYICHANIHY